MIWKILTIVFGWLLCGAWNMRLIERRHTKISRLEAVVYYIFGAIGFAAEWWGYWWPKVHRRITAAIKAFKEADDGEQK